MMNVEGMTRENVASHLQKYRLHLRRLGGLSDKDRADVDQQQHLHEVRGCAAAAAAAVAVSVSIGSRDGGCGGGGAEAMMRPIVTPTMRCFPAVHSCIATAAAYTTPSHVHFCAAAKCAADGGAAGAAAEPGGDAGPA